MVSKAGPKDIVGVAKDEYEDDTTQRSSHEHTQDDRDDATSWNTIDYDGMHIHDRRKQVEENSLGQIDAYLAIENVVGCIKFE